MGAMVARASGWGRVADYGANINDEICLIVQAETRVAMENLDEIAAVEGVDCVFIGPADLSADMGHRGNPRPPGRESGHCRGASPRSARRGRRLASCITTARTLPITVILA